MLAFYVVLACAGCPSEKVASTPPSKPLSTADALRSAGQTAIELHGEAPLDGAGGTIAVAVLTEGGLSLVVREKGALRVHSMAIFDDTKFKVGFADLDGDERADAVLFTSTWAYAFLTPKAGATETDSVSPDDAAGFAMIGATSLEDAIARARNVPRRGTSASEVCRLLGKVAKAVDLRAVTTSSFRLLSYAGTGAGAFVHEPQEKPLDHVTDEEATAIGTSCAPDQIGAMACVANRPACLAGSLANGTYLFFAWPDGKMKLAAAAIGTAK